MCPPTEETTWTEVVRVLDSLDATGCRYWLEGGWGVDALVGAPTRSHRDVDIDLDSDDEPRALRALTDLGYTIETDRRPNRVELVAPGHGWVDLHPFIVARDGSARQAALGGGFHDVPARYFTQGSLCGRSVPCVSREAQLAFHTGYELRSSDRHDLALLTRLDS
jgi:lincosamide nucleotidyltransferase A/C/D/E